MNGLYDIAGLTLIGSGSTVLFNGDATIQDLGSSLLLSTSTLDIASSQSFSLTTLGVNQSTLTGGGAGDLTVTGSITWDGGTISGFETLTIPSQATLTLSDTIDDVGLTLNNYGTTIWNGGNVNLSDGAFSITSPGAA